MHLEIAPIHADELRSGPNIGDSTLIAPVYSTIDTQNEIVMPNAGTSGDGFVMVQNLSTMVYYTVTNGLTGPIGAAISP